MFVLLTLMLLPFVIVHYGHSAEAEKKQKCLARHACFTPLCFSIDGILGTETDIFIRRLGDKLSTKWEKPYSAMAGWVPSGLSFVVLRDSHCCPSLSFYRYFV